MEKKPLCFPCILSIALKFQNDHLLALYENERLFTRSWTSARRGVFLFAHYPPPWVVETIPGGFKVLDATGQRSRMPIAGKAESATVAKELTTDEGRRIAANIAKLPELLNK